MIIYVQNERGVTIHKYYGIIRNGVLRFTKDTWFENALILKSIPALNRLGGIEQKLNCDIKKCNNLDGEKALYKWDGTNYEQLDIGGLAGSKAIDIDKYMSAIEKGFYVQRLMNQNKSNIRVVGELFFIALIVISTISIVSQISSFTSNQKVVSTQMNRTLNYTDIALQSCVQNTGTLERFLGISGTAFNTLRVNNAT